MPIVLPIQSKFDDKGIGQATTGLQKLQKATSGFGIAAGAAFALAAAGAVAFGVQSLKAAAESEAVSKSLQQIAKNSGVFGDTADAVAKSTGEIMKFTQGLSNLVGIDDEILNSVVRGFLAVPELAERGVDGIKDLIKVVADVAAGTGKDLTAIGMIFTKVAGSEETAMSKLARAGIVLSNSQKDIYNQTLETSGEIAAQNKLIEILGTTYAGAAEAAANPFDVLTQNVQNLQEELGTYLLPYFKDFVERVQAFISENGDGLKRVFENAGAALGVVIEGLDAFLAWYTDNPDIFNNIVVGFGAMTAAAVLFSIALSANPVGVIILALGALAAALVALAVNWEAVTTKVEKDFVDLGFSIVMTFDGFINSIIDMLNFLNTPLRAVAELLNAVFGTNLNTTIGRVNNYGDAAIRELQNQGITFGYSGGSVPTGRTMPFAEGGIVRRPMMGLVGEAGPEAIIPLDRMGSMGMGGVSVTINTVAGNPVEIERIVLDAISRASRRGTTRLAV
jgi:hypothetical protein